MRQHPDGLTAQQQIDDALQSAPPRRTLQYRLKSLVSSKRLVMEGTGSHRRTAAGNGSCTITLRGRGAGPRRVGSLEGARRALRGSGAESIFQEHKVDNEGRVNELKTGIRASCEKRVRPSFCLRPRGERGSADGTQRSQDDSDRHCGRGAGAAGVHGACLPVMRASTREEMRRISSTSRSSSRLFSIHSR